jgi:hypothetical protein
MPRSSVTFLTSAFAGAAAFVVAHAIEVAARIGGEQPWFIAALPSAVFTCVFIIAAGVIAGWSMRASTLADAFLVALCVAAGAAVPMTITLFTNAHGPGNLFPFALAIGAGVLLFASVAGVSFGRFLRRRRS